MARGRQRFRTRTVQVFRRARRAAPRIRAGISRVRGSRGFKFGGGLLEKTERAIGKGQLYGGVARKFFPSLAPIAQIYGEYAGGGIEGVAITELIANSFLGLPGGGLTNILGGITGQGGLLGNLLGGGQSSMQQGMMASV